MHQMWVHVYPLQVHISIVLSFVVLETPFAIKKRGRSDQTPRSKRPIDDLLPFLFLSQPSRFTVNSAAVDHDRFAGDVAPRLGG